MSILKSWKNSRITNQMCLYLSKNKKRLKLVCNNFFRSTFGLRSSGTRATPLGGRGTEKVKHIWKETEKLTISWNFLLFLFSFWVLLFPLENVVIRRIQTVFWIRAGHAGARETRSKSEWGPEKVITNFFRSIQIKGILKGRFSSKENARHGPVKRNLALTSIEKILAPRQDRHAQLSTWPLKVMKWKVLKVPRRTGINFRYHTAWRKSPWGLQSRSAVGRVHNGTTSDNCTRKFSNNISKA